MTFTTLQRPALQQDVSLQAAVRMGTMLATLQAASQPSAHAAVRTGMTLTTLQRLLQQVAGVQAVVVPDGMAATMAAREARTAMVKCIST